MVELNFREQEVTQFWGSFSKSFVTCELGADIKILMTNKNMTEKVSKINGSPWKFVAAIKISETIFYFFSKKWKYVIEYVHFVLPVLFCIAHSKWQRNEHYQLKCYLWKRILTKHTYKCVCLKSLH